MLQEGIEPNGRTLGKLLEAATKQSNRQAAQHWFFALANAHSETEELHIHMLVDAVAKEGDFFAAQEWYTRFSADHMDLLTSRIRDVVLCAAARVGDLAQAETLLQDFSKSGLQPDQETFAAVALAILETRDTDNLATIEKWLALAEEALCIEDELGAIARVAKGAARIGCLDIAQVLLEKVFRKVKPECPAPVAAESACFNVIKALGEQGRLDEAEAWVERGQRTGSPEWLRRCCLELVKSFASQKQLGRAERMFLLGQKAGVTDLQAYCIMVNAAAKCCDLVVAERWFEEALDAGIEPDIVLFASLVDAACRKGDMRAAEYWHRRAEAFGLTASKEMLGSLVNGEVRKGNLHGAQRWAAIAKQKYGPNLVIQNCLVDAFAKCKDMISAERILDDDLIGGGLQPDERSFGPLINAYAEQGRFTDAMRCFRSMSVHQVRPSVVQYNQLLKACARSRPRLVQEALQIFEELMEVCAERNQDSPPRHSGPFRGPPRDLRPTRITLKTLGRCVGARRLSQICQAGLSCSAKFESTLWYFYVYRQGAWHRAAGAAGHKIQR